MNRINKKRMSVLTACIISTLVNAAYAAETEELNVYGGEEYVITATKTPLEEKKVPMAVEVITADKMKTIGAYNVRDALRMATNIDVQEAGMTGNKVQLRGMESKHTLILIDGRRMAAENTGSTMNAYELSRINMSDVERIEIIRGNGSALYGSDAMGGVVNIIMKKATEARSSANVFTGTKSSGTSFSYASGRQGKLSFKASGSIEKIRQQNSSYYSDSAKGISDSTNMYGPRRSLNLGFDYELGENKGLALDLNFMREKFTSLSSTPSANGVYDYDNNRSDYALTYYGKDDKNDYNLRTYYNTLKKTNVSTEKGKVSDWDYSSYDTFAVEGKNSMKLNESNTLTYGAEYNETGMKGTRFGGGGDNPFEQTQYGITKEGSEKEIGTYAAYIQDQVQIGDKLLLIPAVRYDHHETFGSNVSPKISSTYSLSDNARVKLNYGKGYRAPTVFELYSEMDKRMGFMNVQVLGNPDLEPEKSTNLDISFEAEKGKTSGRIGYFHNKIDNLIDTGNMTTSGGPGGITITSQYVNIDEAEISGVEAELGYHFNDNWYMKATYNYIDAIDKTTGERLDNRAKQNGIVQLTYTDNATLPFTATLWNQWYIDYQSTTSTTASKVTSQDTFATTNFVIDKKLANNLRVYAGVDNIFDKQLTYTDTHTYAIDGRCWRVGAEMTF